MTTLKMEKQNYTEKKFPEMYCHSTCTPPLSTSKVSTTLNILIETVSQKYSVVYAK
jgi:hypothetical protein